MKIVYDEDIMVAQENNHDYLGMDLNLSITGEARVTMFEFT